LAPGDTSEIAFDIPKVDLTVWNANLKEVFEPGTFDLMVGKSADDIVLKAAIDLK
jgi:beta-glucosidase